MFITDKISRFSVNGRILKPYYLILIPVIALRVCFALCVSVLKKHSLSCN